MFAVSHDISNVTRLFLQHQVGQKVGNDAAPEHHAEVLPAGSAPKESTFKPNPVNETPGQANNPDAAATATGALDFPSATSADVHKGLGHPGAGQTTAETSLDGKTHRARDKTGQQGTGATGGSGLTGEESVEAKRLQEEHTTTGPRAEQEHSISLTGAEGKESASAE